MGAFSHGIADAIRRMGDAQAQGALQKGAVYGNLAHEIGQAPLNYVALDRGLRTNRHLDTMQAAQEKKLKDDQEFEALINQTPPGPERLKVSLEFWQGRDPEKYHALVAGAYQAATQAVGAKQGRPGEPKMTPDPVSGEPTQIDQQTAHAPVQFPGAYGQEPFSVTPQTDTQVAQKTSLQKYMDSLQQEAGRQAGGAGLAAARHDAITVSEGEKTRASREKIAQLPKQDTSTSGVELFMKDPKSYGAMKEIDEKTAARYRATGGPGSGSDQDVKDIVQAIYDGKQSPELTRMYGKSVPVRAGLARKGYDLASAERDWKAINRHLSTLNGTQQERLRQAISFVDETVPQLEAAYAEWKKQAGVSGFPIINRGTLATMKQLPGPAGSAANQLDALIGDFTSELGTVYKGGNSSTDESLKLAATNLRGDWNELTFRDALNRIKQTTKIRKNSIMTSEAVGVAETSPYLPARGATPAPGTPPPPTGGAATWTDADEKRLQELERKAGGR